MSGTLSFQCGSTINLQGTTAVSRHQLEMIKTGIMPPSKQTHNPLAYLVVCSIGW